MCVKNTLLVLVFSTLFDHVTRHQVTWQSRFCDLWKFRFFFVIFVLAIAAQVSTAFISVRKHGASWLVMSLLCKVTRPWCLQCIAYEETIQYLNVILCMNRCLCTALMSISFKNHASSHSFQKEYNKYLSMKQCEKKKSSAYI